MSTTDSALPSWPDTHALYERFATLVNQPMRPIRPDAMPKVLRWFDDHCAGSKRLAERAATCLLYTSPSPRDS